MSEKTNLNYNFIYKKKLIKYHKKCRTVNIKSIHIHINCDAEATRFISALEFGHDLQSVKVVAVGYTTLAKYSIRYLSLPIGTANRQLLQKERTLARGTPDIRIMKEILNFWFRWWDMWHYL